MTHGSDLASFTGMDKIDLRAELAAFDTDRTKHERSRITAALEAESGNMAAAARLLSLPLRTIWRRCDALGLAPDGFRS